MTCAGLHRTAPGVTEQLVDCSGGDVKDEETGFARKADALTRVMANEVREAPFDTDLVLLSAAPECFLPHLYVQSRQTRFHSTDSACP